MSTDTRPPPPQFAAKLRRALGGRAGWRGFALQILFVAALAWIGYEIVANARANLQSQRIASGFGFMSNTAGFDVSQTLIPYSGSDTYTRVFLVGLLNSRGLFIPRPIASLGLDAFAFAVLAAIVGALLLRQYARWRLFNSGKAITIWPYTIGLLVGLPLLSGLVLGKPFTLEFPQLKGFNFAGGASVIPEFVALTVALSLYTAAFIAEIVRAGIQSVHKGQMEAGASLGLSRGSTLRLIVVPQALRVILPPLTSQYLNLTKNSSLAVAIGYPDLVSVFAGTTLSQTGQAVEIIAITMGVYLLLSLVTSAIMNFYGWRISRSMGT